MTSRGVLVIRADADIRMGTGHVMRCLALAQAWEQRGGRTLFVCGTLTPALATRLQSERFEVMPLAGPVGSLDDARATIEMSRRASASWIVVDGYQFSVDYHRAIKAAGLKLLVIDDFGHADHYLADLVLNQNAHADESFYRHRESWTRLLLGSQYAMLRREFWAWRGWKRRIPPVAGQLLVTLGGSDPDNATLKMIEAIGGLDIEGLETTVLVGGSNPHRVALENVARKAVCPVHLENNVTDMPSWLARADAAITAGGGTLWELAFLAVPSLTVILAENQEPAAHCLAERSVFPTLGWGAAVSIDTIRQEVRRLLLSCEVRQKCSEQASALVDGNGAFRVVDSMD